MIWAAERNREHGALVAALYQQESDVMRAEGRHGGRAAAVRHFFLKVPADVLRQRIETQVIHPGDPVRDAEVRAWQLSQVERCAAAADALPFDTVILDGELPAARITGEVLSGEATEGRTPPGPSPA